MKSIGERIRARRGDQRMTLAELGERVGLSISYLSQVERDKTTPSLSTLTSIAKTLNVPLRHFFETEAEAAWVVRADRLCEGSPADPGVTRQPLSPRAGNNKLEVYQIILSPHTPLQQLSPYPGEDFAFVLSGELTLLVGEEEFTLVSGDSIHYDALQPHAWANRGNGPCVAICSHSAPWSEHPSS